MSAILIRLALLCSVFAALAADDGRSSSDASNATPKCGIAADLGYCRYPGPAPVIVMLTGLGNTMQSWPSSFLQAMNRNAEIVVYDRRGSGRSAPLPPAPVTAKAGASDLRALLGALAIRPPVVLVGHSLGGLYAQYFARNYPQDVAGVVLLDPATPFEPVDDPRFHTRARLAPGSTDDWENRGIDAAVLATRESPPFPRVPLIVISATDHASPPDFEEEWQKIQAKTAAQSPLGRFVVARGSGHDIQNDQPTLVIDEVRQLMLELCKSR